jgi:hypothetical protein
MTLGPADANHFRVKVGRYGDRWYTDPLPADHIAPATEDAWPSFSIIKGASGKDWTFVGLKRVAYASTTELERLPGLPVEQRYDTCKSINAHGLKVAAGRGTILHWWGEDLLHGRSPRKVTSLDLVAAKIPAESLAEAHRYLAAFQQFFDTYQPELVAAEYVAIHRTLNDVGYGCTPDGLWKIEGDLWAFDYKSRTADGDHSAYPEEGAQIAAGTHAEYMIVEGSDGAERRPIPAVTGGMVVSLKPEGVRIFPVNLDEGFAHYEAMHAWWVARRTERDGIGRPWPVKKREPDKSDGVWTARESGPAPALTRDTVVARARRLIDAGHVVALQYAWPEGVPGLKGDHPHTDGELRAIYDAICTVEDDHNMSPGFTDADRTLPTTPSWDEQRRRSAIRKARLAWDDYWADDVMADILYELIPGGTVNDVNTAFEALTIDEADQLAEMADSLNNGYGLEHNGSRWAVTQPKEPCTP